MGVARDIPEFRDIHASHNQSYREDIRGWMKGSPNPLAWVTTSFTLPSYCEQLWFFLRLGQSNYLTEDTSCCAAPHLGHSYTGTLAMCSCREHYDYDNNVLVFETYKTLSKGKDYNWLGTGKPPGYAGFPTR